MARGLLILRHAVLPATPPTIVCATFAPAPVPTSGDQDWPSASNKANQRLTVLALAIASVLAIVFLLLIYYVVLLRHRSSLRRRRRRRLIRSLTGTDPPDGDADADAVNHHAWHIRTVGLSQEVIEAIPVVEFGEEWKGAVDDCDCAVCLSEFDRGELLRLLPKCGHAFHVECIDTWLQSHVNCPLCRAPVVPAPVTPAPGDDGGDSPESSEAGGAYAAAAELAGDLEDSSSQIGLGPTSPSPVKVITGGTEYLSGSGESSLHGSSQGNAPDPQLNDLEDYDSEGSPLPNDGHQTSPYTLSYLTACMPVQRSISMDSSPSATSLPTMELCGSSDGKELALGNHLPVSGEEKQENDPKGMSDDKNPIEMGRSLSGSGGNFLLSKFGRGRSSSVLPL